MGPINTVRYFYLVRLLYSIPHITMDLGLKDVHVLVTGACCSYIVLMHPIDLIDRCKRRDRPRDCQTLLL